MIFMTKFCALTGFWARARHVNTTTCSSQLDFVDIICTVQVIISTEC